MTSKLTREQLHERARENVKALKMASRQTAFESAREEILADLQLAELALAAMDSEPVAWLLSGGGAKNVVCFDSGNAYADPLREVTPLYRHAQPAPEYPEVLPCLVLLEPGLRFGKGIKTITMLAALARRAVYESDMTALSPEERAEFQAGIEDFKALIAQPAPASEPVYQYWCYTTVENSEGDPEEFWFWKDCEKDFYDRWKNAKRTLYKTPQPAPVVPEEATPENVEMLSGYISTYKLTDSERDIAAEIWNACRAAMLQAEPVCTCPSGDGSLRWPCSVHPGNSPVIGIDVASGPDRTVEVHYVAPPGYVMVPKEPTEAMMLHNSGCQHHAWDDPDCAMRQTRRLIWSHMLAAAPQEAKVE